MNKKDEALKMAIEAMENSIVYCEDLHHAIKDLHKYSEPCPVEQRWNATIQACKEALEQPLQEPVIEPTYYVKHPDGTFSEAIPQPSQEPPKVESFDIWARTNP